jgi:transposase
MVRRLASPKRTLGTSGFIKTGEFSNAAFEENAPATHICFAHARRGFFELADIEKNAREGHRGKPVSPIALEAVRRLDALFEIERAINGRGADERRAVRHEKSKPLLEDMHAWLLLEREPLSRSSEVLKPMNYMLRRWDDFARFLDDGRICLTTIVLSAH